MNLSTFRKVCKTYTCKFHIHHSGIDSLKPEKETKLKQLEIKHSIRKWLEDDSQRVKIPAETWITMLDN